MKTKLRFLFVAGLISLSVVFSTTGRIFFNDNYGVAFGSTNYISYWDWCGQYQLGSCSTPPPPVINDYYVDDDNISGPWNGTIPNPYNKIEDAINAASSGNTIYVAGGTYQENIVLSETVTLEGGWNGAFSQRDISVNVTTIDGSGNPATVIKTYSNDSTIDGFTITNGNSPEFVEGGGIFIDSGSPTITHNIITQNTTGEQGGGIYIDYASPVIANNTITGNHADELGGGIMLRAAFPGTIIANNIISGNVAGEGGGICNYFTSNVVTNNIIVDNTAVKGGGIYLYGLINELNTCIISNNTIANNTASSGDGGGIYVDYDAYPTITNTILWGNGDELYVTPGESVFISFSDIDDVNYNGPNNNISMDPLFVNPSTGDYHLLLGSPAIDAGRNTALYFPNYSSIMMYDISGEQRGADGDGNGPASGDGSDYDIGAYEMPAMQAFVENNPEQVSEMDDMGEDVALLQRELDQMINAGKLDIQIKQSEITRKYFDDTTLQAVIAFQQQHHLSPPGIMPQGIVDEPPSKPFSVSGYVVKPVLMLKKSPGL